MSIKFGTGGWRAVIGDGFTKANVQLLTAALARKMKEEGVAHRGAGPGPGPGLLLRRPGPAALGLGGLGHPGAGGRPHPEGGRPPQPGSGTLERTIRGRDYTLRGTAAVDRLILEIENNGGLSPRDEAHIARLLSPDYDMQNEPSGNIGIAYVPAKGERKASEAIGGISMGYFITKKAWDDPAKQAAAVDFVKHMTSDEVLSTFVTTEVTALKNGASPAGLNALQQASADANASITGVVGAVQDTITSECKTDLFANVQNVVTGKMSAADAVTSAIALN